MRIVLVVAATSSVDGKLNDDTDYPVRESFLL